MRKNILLIEDTQALAQLLGDILRMEDFEVQIAYDGLMALEYLEHHTPDIILTDLAMPHLGGLELLRKIRQSERHHSIPVIIHSAHASADNREACREAGADMFFEKPVDIDELIDYLATVPST